MPQTNLVLYLITTLTPNAYLVVTLRLVYVSVLAPSVREWYRFIVTLTVYSLPRLNKKRDKLSMKFWMVAIADSTVSVLGLCRNWDYFWALQKKIAMSRYLLRLSRGGSETRCDSVLNARPAIYLVPICDAFSLIEIPRYSR